jgi:hypothetical protein
VSDDEELAGREWSDPNQEHVLRFFGQQIQETANRRGTRGACVTCSGLRVIVMVDHTTNKPFNVPCSACNPGGS